MRAHETVMAWVHRQLASGAVRIGDRLPGERQLAEQLGVSRAGVREALRILEAMGSVAPNTGSGPKSGTIIISAPQNAHALAFNLQLATQRVKFSDVVETRLLLETWAAENSRTQGFDWQEAENLLERMDDPALRRAEFLALDAQFHTELARSAANPMISTLMDAIRTAIADHGAERAEQLADWTTATRQLQAEHRQILAAFQAGNSGDAARLVREHILGYYQATGGAN